MDEMKFIRFLEAASLWHLTESECVELAFWKELPPCHHLAGSCHMVFDIKEAQRFKEEIQPGGARHGRVEFILGRSFEM